MGTMAANPIEQEPRPQQLSSTSSALAKWLMVFSQLYRQEATEAAVWAYREALADLTPGEIDRGCREAIRRLKFFPNPAEIRECLTIARANAKPKQLPALPEAQEESAEDREARELALATLREIAGRNDLERIAANPSEQELQRRARAQKRRVEEWASAHRSELSANQAETVAARS
jgi:hypothetical protein